MACYLHRTIQNVLDTLSAASIFHMGATVPERLLRCVLDPRDMVTIQTGAFNAPIENGGVLPSDAPGLGVTMNRDLLGQAVAIWED
ncbi:hypothetical protein [Ruegeria sp.]|uniref:hypothetical protein n=1 Tax=Ruegeria sp. TaxID=1879320 RepID=UPI003B00CA04